MTHRSARSPPGHRDLVEIPAAVLHAGVDDGAHARWAAQIVKTLCEARSRHWPKSTNLRATHQSVVRRARRRRGSVAAGSVQRVTDPGAQCSVGVQRVDFALIRRGTSCRGMKRTTRSSSCAALKAKCATNARAQSRSVGQISMPFRQTSGEAQCGNTAGRADLPRLSACVRTWLLVNYALPLTWHRFVSGLGGNWHQPPTEELGKRCQAQGTQGGR